MNPGTNKNCQSFLQESQTRVNRLLQLKINTQYSVFSNTQEPDLQRLKQASAYCINNGGKRLRPSLVYATAKAISNKPSTHDLDLIAAAVECIHSYSLVHDDLPAMDDDDLRRGNPTCHIAYDEATAILVGDGLQSFAFELLAETENLTTEIQIRLVKLLAQASGNFGMVGGQMIDLQSAGQQLTLQQLEQMHSLKTGALICASIAMGATAAGATTNELKALNDYAKAIGLAFQVQDDILDIESDTETLGKTQGADEKLQKATYPALLGLEQAKDKAQQLVNSAHQALAHISGDTEQLHQLADFIIQRNH